MENIGGFGLELTLFASITFPNGLTITQFADDADAFDTPALQVRDKAMGLNGDLVVWGKAQAIVVTINVIPGSDDDINLSVIGEANRVGKGKRSVQDILSCTLAYPNGQTEDFTAGTITDYTPASGVTSAGRMKTKQYQFAFENKV